MNIVPIQDKIFMLWESTNNNHNHELSNRKNIQHFHQIVKTSMLFT